MITAENQIQLQDGVYTGPVTLFGLSTDTKPTGAEVANGSCFLEMDTAKIFFYDADGETWREWGAGA